MTDYDPTTQVEVVRERLAALEHVAAQVRLDDEDAGQLGAVIASLRGSAAMLIAVGDTDLLTQEEKDRMQRNFYNVIEEIDEMEDALLLIIERVPSLRKSDG